MNWSIGDFIFAAVLLAVAASLGFILLRSRTSPHYKLGAAIAVLAGLSVVAATGSVGIIGSEDNKANFLLLAIVGIGVGGAVVSRCRSTGLALTLALMAILQAGVGLAALVLGWGRGSASWPWDVVLATLFFTIAWAVCALCFRASARRAMSA